MNAVEEPKPKKARGSPSKDSRAATKSGENGAPMVPTFRPPHRKGTFVVNTIMAVGLTSAVFFLLPFTQMIAALGKKEEKFLTVDVSLPPPPPPPMDFDPPEPPPQEAPPPEMQRQVQQLSLSQLDVALNVGTGDAMAGSFTFDGFGVSADDTASDLDIFDIKDLDKNPAIVKAGRLIAPAHLQRARIPMSAVVQVIIDQNGRVKVDKILESSPREFEAAAIRFAEETIFEPPMKSGKAVRASYKWPVKIQY